MDFITMSENGETELKLQSTIRNMLDFESCYQAHHSKDPRFDGVFFAGVSSTGIYCRTVCPVKTPKPENLSFHPSAAAAENAGFRPCLRCRPELAPGRSSVDAVSRLAVAAAHRIEEGCLSEMSLPELAGELGVSDRHLRRAIRTEYGVSPVELAQTQRLLLAKQLLRDTRLGVGEIAMAAGFGSVRRFNDLFHSRYRLNPSAMRRAPIDTDHECIQVDLGYRPPLDHAAVMAWLSQRCLTGYEAVIEGSYWRTVQAGNATGWLQAHFVPERSVLRLRVSASLACKLPGVTRRIRRLFDLDARPASVSAVLGELAAGREGLRVPGAFEGFEVALRAIIGQQVSVSAATTVARRLSDSFCEPLPAAIGPLTYLPVRADRIADLKVGEVASLGMPGKRAETIIHLARAVSDGMLKLSPGVVPDATVEALKSLPGIGDWTAQYVAMRALSWPDAFPASDLGLLRASGASTAKELLERAEAWRPWRSYAAMHLWHSGANGG